MSYTEFISNCISLCRICLSKSSNMKSFESKYDSSEDSPTLIRILEKALGEKVNSNPRYPRNVCYACLSSIECSIDIKDVFQCSQNILEKYVHLKQIAVKTIKAAEKLEDNTCDEKNNTLEEESEDNKNVTLDNGVEKTKQTRVRPSKQMMPRCHYCFQRFKTKELVKEHVPECNRKIRVKCDYCGKIMLTKYILRSHLRLKHPNEIGHEPLEYKCDLCDEVFNSCNARNYHKTTRHYSKGEMHVCEICKKSFLVPSSLKQHMQSHNKDASKVVCPICGKSFHYSGGLFYHMKMHRNERDYVCTVCGQDFLTISALKKHQFSHTNERPFMCSICPKSFTAKGDMLTHEKRHSGSKFHPCKYCDKTFITNWASRLHMSSHPGTIECGECSKGLLNEEVLKLHCRMKHNIDV